jgi:hypothetical protein
LTPAVETPIRAKKNMGMAGIEVGESEIPMPATTPIAPKPMKPFFLPMVRTTRGMRGAMTKIAPTLSTVRMTM